MTEKESEEVDSAGPHHEVLARLEGRYRHLTKVRMEPDQEPLTGEGKAELTMILDGRFLREERTWMMPGGPIHYLKLFGYNNATGLYEAVWTFDRSTAILMLTGTPEDGGKTIRWASAYDNLEGEKVLIEAATRLRGEGDFVLELYGTGSNGERFTVQETSYHRLP